MSKLKRNEASPTIIRSEIFWFDDGNIILEAEGQQFRIHRGMLSRHSNVFRDMFNMPQPSKEPTIEGCPVVKLPDKAEDWGHVLSALYDRSYHSGDGQPISVVEAMVRLGCRYGFVPLCQEATSRLKHEYPADLDAYTSDHTRIEVDDSIELLDLLKLAQEHNELHSILPSLYHEIHNSFNLGRLLTEPDARFTSEQKLNMATNFLNFRDAPTRLTYQWLQELPFAGCNSANSDLACAQAGAKIYFEVFFGSEFAHGLDEWDCAWAKQLCNSCADQAKTAHLVGRKEYWEELPGYVGLGSWETLMKSAGA